MKKIEFNYLIFQNLTAPFLHLYLQCGGFALEMELDQKRKFQNLNSESMGASDLPTF